MKTDVQIAQEAQKQHIREIAQKVGVSEDNLELYGNFKAKVDLEVLENLKDKPNGKLILVTAPHQLKVERLKKRDNATEAQINDRIKNQLPDEQKISKAAQRVLECRRIQYEIAAGLVDELHPDGEAYKVSLKELKKIEEDYLSLFVGKSTYDKETFGFDYVPKSGGKSEAVFRISDENGIVPASDLSGKPVMIEFEIDKDLAQKYTGMVKSDNPGAGHSGVYYRVPGRAVVRLINDMNVIATTRATIAQFGAIAPMPEEVLNGEFVIEINPETGAVKSIQKK